MLIICVNTLVMGCQHQKEPRSENQTIIYNIPMEINSSLANNYAAAAEQRNGTEGMGMRNHTQNVKMAETYTSCCS